jgi:hypothetical protein
MANREESQGPSNQAANYPTLPTPTEPAIPERKTAEDSTDKTANDKDTSNRLKEFRWFEIATLIVNSLLALAGFLVLCVYNRQLGVMQGQLKQMMKGTAQTESLIREATTQSKSSEIAANAAKRAADTASLTMRLDERARLRIGYPAIPMNVGSRISVPVTMENTGKTEARNLHGVIAVSVTMPDAVPDFTYIRGYYSWDAGYLPQGIVDTHTWNALNRTTREDIILTTEINNALRSATEAITINGRIEYEDVFRVRHWLKFCQQGAALQNGMPIRGSKECAAYNQSDDNQ